MNQLYLQVYQFLQIIPKVKVVEFRKVAVIMTSNISSDLIIQKYNFLRLQNSSEDGERKIV